MAKTYKRRILFINRSVQLKVIGYAAVFSIFSSAMTAVFIRLLIARTLTGEPISFQLEFAFFLGGSAILTALFIAGLYLTNRICGPIYRLHAFMIESMEEKEPPTPVRIRKGDEWVQLVDHFGQFVDHLRGKSSDEP